MKNFTKHTIESAPEESKELLKYGEKKYGTLPNLFRYMAGAPASLEAYNSLFKIFGKTTFTAGEQHLILLSASVVNECAYCTAAHTRAAKANGIRSSILNAVRKEKPVDDERLNVLVNITKKLTETRGHIDKNDLETFYNAGFSPENVLEIITGIALKTLSNYINHVTENVINESLEPFAVGKEIED
ncbi:carboxymuconolactone decarboxylase family protein [Zobellia roscoffensis]|uniref:carboxymuconolactone decarboxylase family protein n=1 Tax=Zobellia TaxID=112040 RepID=UPI001889ECF3|nr:MULTISPECIES: carboxymuconolactone decarboxylase family protein [Zobellia]